MMEQDDFAIEISQRLESLDIDYMIVGSYASSLYGEPRATNDLDVVISCRPGQLRLFVKGFGESCYADLEAALEALDFKSMFNIINLENGLKADFMINKDRPYAREALRRRRSTRIGNAKLFIIAPEDSILSKLEWAAMSESERQLRDAFGVAMAAWETLDRDYLELWARELGVFDALNAIFSKVRETQGP